MTRFRRTIAAVLKVRHLLPRRRPSAARVMPA
jgi:hypothetical protein